VLKYPNVLLKCTFALGNESLKNSAGYTSSGDCVVWNIPLGNSGGLYWRYQPLGYFNLPYSGDSHGEPFAAEFNATVKIGLSGDSAQSFNPMAYLKKCQNARIVYSTGSNPQSTTAPQPFTSIGIDSFNNNSTQSSESSSSSSVDSTTIFQPQTYK
jgi:hypothetical protein